MRTSLRHTLAVTTVATSLCSYTQQQKSALLDTNVQKKDHSSRLQSHVLGQRIHCLSLTHFRVYDAVQSNVRNIRIR